MLQEYKNTQLKPTWAVLTDSHITMLLWKISSILLFLANVYEHRIYEHHVTNALR